MLSLRYLVSFCTERTDLVTKRGGGILAFVSEKLKVRREYNLEESELEVLWMSINPFNSNRAILFGTVYRPPSSDSAMDERLERNLENGFLQGNEIHIHGDFNIDFMSLNYKKHCISKALKSMNLTQLLNTTTRPVSGTCLDHFYSSHPQYISHVVVPTVGISDHLPVFVCRRFRKVCHKSQDIFIQYRRTKNINKSGLMTSLSYVPWDICFVFDDIDDSLFAFESLLKDVLDEHIPVIEKRVNKQVQPPWMNNDIKEAMKERDKRLKRARRWNLTDDWLCYRRAKNKTTNLIKKAKRNFFSQSIDEHKGNPKGIWR